MASRTTLNVSMPLELGRFVTDQVQSGRYATASEVVRAALRLLQAEEGQTAQRRGEPVPLSQDEISRRK